MEYLGELLLKEKVLLLLVNTGPHLHTEEVVKSLKREAPSFGQL